MDMARMGVEDDAILVDHVTEMAAGSPHAIAIRPDRPDC
jgi:hypothetical protein